MSVEQPAGEQPPIHDGPGRVPGDGETFGAQLRAYRQAAGLTQAALGHRVGIHQSYINRLERGEREPPGRELVARLAEALRLDEPSRQRLLRAAGHVPDWLLTLPADDPTLLAVGRFLADPAVSAAAKQEFRQLIALVLRRWRVE
jgi:transcriptional regulator with XRE-family HTH domain